MQPVAEPSVLVVAATGQGGVAGVVDTVVPRLGPGVTRISTRPAGRAAWRIGAGREAVVHLHPSLRPRALVRDTVLYAVARASGRAVVVQIHGWSEVQAARLDRDPRPFVRGLGSADVLLVQVEAHAARLARWGVDPSRIRQITNPYDPLGVADVHTPVSGQPLVLCLARWVADKRIPAVIEAVAELDARLVLAGDGPERKRIVETLGRLGLSDRVLLTGWIGPAARRAWLARASVVVSASREEGFPLALVEALASGVPVVATDTGATARLVGDAGRVVQTVPELAAAIDDVLHRPPIDAVARARTRIRACCAPDVVAAQWTAAHRAAMEVAGGRW